MDSAGQIGRFGRVDERISRDAYAQAPHPLKYQDWNIVRALFERFAGAIRRNQSKSESGR